jgi:hypothetical protein
VGDGAGGAAARLLLMASWGCTRLGGMEDETGGFKCPNASFCWSSLSPTDLSAL